MVREVADGGGGLEILQGKDAEGYRGVEDVGGFGVEAVGGE